MTVNKYKAICDSITDEDKELLLEQGSVYAPHEHGHWEGKADISFLFDEKEFYDALNERLRYSANHTEDEYFEHFATFTCSICGARSCKTTPYCSECGAKMEVE